MSAVAAPMKIASWNVNSIRVRLERLLKFLERERPDVVCLQELKVQTEGFPREAVEAAGYKAVCLGQKTYNGVAILSRAEPREVQLGMEDGADDPQARLAAATVGGVRVFSAYVPNGQAVGSDKWQYKLEWLARLRRMVDARCRPGDPVVICGDFNVAPDDRDVHDPAQWSETVICHPGARDALRHFTDWGLSDTFRLHSQEGGHYSWWDYQAGAFHRGWGLRIDFVFASAGLAARCTSATIDRDERKGTQPSDHAPVMAVFDV